MDQALLTILLPGVPKNKWFYYQQHYKAWLDKTFKALVNIYTYKKEDFSFAKMTTMDYVVLGQDRYITNLVSKIESRLKLLNKLTDHLTSRFEI